MISRYSLSLSFSLYDLCNYGKESDTIRATHRLRDITPFLFLAPLSSQSSTRRIFRLFSSTLYLIGLISIAFAIRNRRSEHHGDHATRIRYYRRRLSRCIHSHVHVHTFALTFRSLSLGLVCPVIINGEDHITGRTSSVTLLSCTLIIVIIINIIIVSVIVPLLSLFFTIRVKKHLIEQHETVARCRASLSIYSICI